jgi:hypothetical protein
MMPISKSATSKVRVNATNDLIFSNKVVVKGRWELDDSDTLTYKVSAERKDQYGEKVVFLGTFSDSESHSVSIQLDEKSYQSELQGASLALSGSWYINELNKLQFRVKRSGGDYDTLEFQGKWILDNHHTITYMQNERHLKRGLKRDHDFKLKGYWSSFSNGRLYYELNGSPEAPLSIAAGIARLDKGRIVAKLMSEATIGERTIELTGKWVIHPKVGLGIELDYGDNIVKVMGISIDFKMSKNARLTLKASDEFSAELVKKILDDNTELVAKYTQNDSDFELYFGAKISF